MAQIKTDMTESEQKLIYNFLINFVLGILKDLKPKHVHEYAKNNKGIDPRVFFRGLPPDIMMRIKPAIHDNKEIIDQIINYENILKALKPKRPDLYMTLSIPQYKTWFVKFIGIIKQTIFSL